MRRAKHDLVLRAKLMLAARGVPATAMSMAGAMLEGERDAWIVAYVEAVAKQGK